MVKVGVKVGVMIGHKVGGQVWVNVGESRLGRGSRSGGGGQGRGSWGQMVGAV